MPERFEQMLVAYRAFERDNRVQPLPTGYSQGRQLATNYARERLGPAIIVILLTALVLLPFLVFYRMRRRTKS